jgi:hypothetical protein
VRDAVERVAISGHEGKSGAGLERVRLADGRVLVVKRLDPATDLTAAAAGGAPGREYLLWKAGVFERLPPGVTHALVDAWLEGDITVLAMRDLGDAVLSWSRRLSADEAAWVMQRTAELHRAFLGSPAPEVAPLDGVLTLFAPAQVREQAARGNELMGLAQRGWELFADQVPADVGDAVFGLLDDIAPLRSALEAGR